MATVDFLADRVFVLTRRLLPSADTISSVVFCATMRTRVLTSPLFGQLSVRVARFRPESAFGHVSDHGADVGLLMDLRHAAFFVDGRDPRLVL